MRNVSYVLAALVLLLSQIAIPALAREDYVKDYYKELGAYPDISSPNRLTYAKLKAEIQKRPGDFRSLDDVLGYLSHSSYRDIFRQFTLMYASRSLQRAAVSPSFPRAIFYKDGFIAAVSGNPSKSVLYNMLEVIEYDPDKHAFAFHQIDFPKATPRFQDQPKSCKACHGEGEAIRPIWGSYPSGQAHSAVREILPTPLPGNPSSWRDFSRA